MRPPTFIDNATLRVIQPGGEFLGLIAANRASVLATEALVVLDGAIIEIAPLIGVSDDMIKHLQWNVRRLLAGEVIGELKP